MTNKTIVLLTLLLSNFMVYAESMQGQPAPTFNLQDQTGEQHQLNDYAGQWLVVYFYPKDDTSGCTIEAKAFRDNYQVLKAMNTEVLGVSLDDAASHQAFIDKHNLPFNLLVDSDKMMSRAYGVDGGMAFFSYAKRQTFIIDPKGYIAEHFEDVDPSSHFDEVFVALKKLQSDQAVEKVKATEVVVTEENERETLYGKRWSKEALKAADISTALQNPADYVDEPMLITGNITRVCQKQGCWMILANGDDFARVDFNDHAFLIPKDSQGRAEVYGRLVAKTLTAEQKAHFEAEGSGQLKADGYEIIAEGVKILK